ncbi:phosphonate metabolism protein PhnP [Serratia sp. JUb9]|uniref:phosphonate metabolism protein PhnP n=1 Tax=Serratia sp. JUb9 TaxID=2724469 RepID=UPI00164EA7B8|nr:phosphonate metabolism protein PhnP [Serratia sp. JUb9]QNK32073.1 phosphonate metabolism protein PhnP [Serratia sp. JUb9]
MQLTFLGTGGAQQVPAFGCACAICQRARREPARRRRACSAMLDYQGETTLIDAGLTSLERRFSAGQIQRFLLTHYHMDHVQGLFHLRWGCGSAIPVYGPPDEQGCDDLFRHPGILDFQPPLAPFVSITLGGLRITPLPLIHSKITHGYLIQSADRTLAYLTDTVGLPPDTLRFLQGVRLDLLVLDCSLPPQAQAPRNHNDLTRALEIQQRLLPQRTLLTHISHHLDAWLLTHPLPPGLELAYDGLCIDVSAPDAPRAAADRTPAP